jgi:hypothetical protein
MFFLYERKKKGKIIVVEIKMILKSVYNISININHHNDFSSLIRVTLKGRKCVLQHNLF